MCRPGPSVTSLNTGRATLPVPQRARCPRSGTHSSTSASATPDKVTTRLRSRRHIDVRECVGSPFPRSIGSTDPLAARVASARWTACPVFPPVWRARMILPHAGRRVNGIIAAGGQCKVRAASRDARAGRGGRAHPDRGWAGSAEQWNRGCGCGEAARGRPRRWPRRRVGGSRARLRPVSVSWGRRCAPPQCRNRKRGAGRSTMWMVRSNRARAAAAGGARGPGGRRGCRGVCAAASPGRGPGHTCRAAVAWAGLVLRRDVLCNI